MFAEEVVNCTAVLIKKLGSMLTLQQRNKGWVEISTHMRDMFSSQLYTPRDDKIKWNKTTTRILIPLSFASIMN